MRRNKCRRLCCFLGVLVEESGRGARLLRGGASVRVVFEQPVEQLERVAPDTGKSAGDAFSARIRVSSGAEPAAQNDGGQEPPRREREREALDGRDRAPMHVNRGSAARGPRDLSRGMKVSNGWPFPPRISIPRSLENHGSSECPGQVRWRAAPSVCSVGRPLISTIFFTCATSSDASSGCTSQSNRRCESQSAERCVSCARCWAREAV
jgi:hypothetical protein